MVAPSQLERITLSNPFYYPPVKKLTLTVSPESRLLFSLETWKNGRDTQELCLTKTP